ncbi:MAG: ABC transporter permease, partial [Verrucomicrobiota bacterium]
AYIARLTRSSMLDVRSEDYMRTARAKGLSSARVYLLHGLRNGLTPVISFLGPALAGLISGSFVVETIFFIPGLGQFFVQAALDNDYWLLLGIVLFYAALIIVFNLISDILLVWLNPRRKLS